MVKALIVSFLILLCFISSCDTFQPSTKSTTSTKEPFHIPSKTSRFPEIAELKVIKRWEGTRSQDIKFNATTAPWVINAGYETTSQLSSIFELEVTQTTELEGFAWVHDTVRLTTGDIIGLIEDSGVFIIHIKASGVNWWVKIGVE